MPAKYAMFQVVVLVTGYENLPAGTSGTILHIYEHTNPAVYEIEFMDSQGRTYVSDTEDTFTYTIEEFLLRAVDIA